MEISNLNEGNFKNVESELVSYPHSPLCNDGDVSDHEQSAAVLPVAVLLIAFNRPQLLAALIERLRLVRPARVYLAIDGPRPSRAGEAGLVNECRALVTAIDWPCEVFTLFRSTNLGCGLGVSSAISWFFTYEERGIILEDDILPDATFFKFCLELLERYQEDERVFSISGCNYVPKAMISRSGEYRFSRLPHVWGWATWRRSWECYEFDMRHWLKRLGVRGLWRGSGRSVPEMFYWARLFHLLSRG